MDQFVQSVGTGERQHRRSARRATPNDGHGLLRRQHRHRPVELRPALRDERQLVTARRSGRPPRARSTSSPATPATSTRRTTANSPSIATSTAPNADLTADGKGGYSLTSDAQPYWDDCSTRDAVALNGHEHRRRAERRRPLLGLVPGRLPADRELPGGARGDRPHRPADEHVHPRRVQERRLPELGAALDQPGPLRRRAPGRRRPRRHRPVGLQGRLHPAPRAVPVLRLDGQPAPPDDRRPTRAATTRWPACSLSTIGTRHAVATSATASPQFNTPNHNYDMSDFDQLVAAINAGTAAAVGAARRSASSRRPGYQDGHAAYSDPADEQEFIVDEINALSRRPDWTSTAVIINYDDSDGWYDHAYSGVTNPSLSPADNLTNTVPGRSRRRTRPRGSAARARRRRRRSRGEQGRCGFGPRLPMLVDLAVREARTTSTTTSATRPRSSTSSSTTGSLPAIPGSFDQALAQHRPSRGHPVRPGGHVRLPR